MKKAIFMRVDASAAPWIMPAAVLIGIQFAGALLLNVYIGVAQAMPIQTYCTYALLAAALVGGPVSLITTARGEDGIGVFARTILGFQFIALELGAVTWTKSMLPLIAPFWADPYLANADALLLGQDAWTLLHPAPRWFDLLINITYYAWMPLQFIAVGVLILAPSNRRRTLGILAYLSTWAIGIVLQFAFSSGGPIFFERLGFGSRFADLNPGAATLRTAGYLWTNYTSVTPTIGTGISAMPSLHVGIATWLALVMAKGRFAGFGWAYLVLIVTGSVYLGWHYAMDGIVGICIALIGWRLARRIGEQQC